MPEKFTASEVDSYIFIKESLETLGWDTRNPERVASGQVYTQNECLANPEIKKYLVLDKPENIVKVNEHVLWVIEAKRSHSQLDLAVAEAKVYAEKLNRSTRFKVLFISGVAGNIHDSFLVRNYYFTGRAYELIELNGVPVTGLLSPDQTEHILQSQKPRIDNPKVDEKLFLTRAERINEILHLGAVNPHQRAGVMAALLLSTLSSTFPNIEGTPVVLIKDINSRVEDVLERQGKREFVRDVSISLPATTDNHIKLRQALVDTLQELNSLNIRSAMKSGDDWLGAFYEVFLKYASWAQDLGIVLTPRHITRFIADVMDIQPNDIIYDPTCGTGGFLVAALDYVKKHSNNEQIARFKQYSVFGVEQDSGVAALAVVNMIFRGDGKNNIHEGNCFAKFLESHVEQGTTTAKYVATSPVTPPVTKVMMNPPFSLKRSDEKEFKFINYALKQMQHGGILFSVLPYSSMVKPGVYLTWRKEELLRQNTLLAVVTFPGDLFYPVGVTSVGIFIKKGIPHPSNQKVLWIRATSDGHLKRKGRRLPDARATNDLEQIRDVLKAFLRNPEHTVASFNKFYCAAGIDWNDPALELVPEVYLEQAIPTEEDLLQGIEDSLRETFAYLVKIDRAVIKPDLFTTRSFTNVPVPYSWTKFCADDIFKLDRGHFHSIAALDEGIYPTISRVSTDNGFVGFYDMPEGAEILPPRTLTVSTVAGDTFVQPVPFIATDNVVLCTPKGKFKNLRLETLYFIALMFNMVKWRYSYGRQCYKYKFANTEIWLPVTQAGEVDEDYIAALVQSAAYWHPVQAIYEDYS